MKEVKITTDYIKLGQLLKLLGLVDTGGEVLGFLLAADIQVDGVDEKRRGRKLYPGARIRIDQADYLICS